MTLLQESTIYALYRLLLKSYHRSALRRVLRNLGRWWQGQTEHSRVLRFALREGALAKGWESSLLCALLSFIVTLPGLALHALYRAARPLWDGSALCRGLFEAGSETAVAESWILLALWVIPFDYWNNAYSLTAYAALLALFHLGAMRRRSFQLDVGAVGAYPVAFFALAALAVPLSYKTNLSIRFFGFHLAAALCVLVTVSAVRNGEDLKRLAAGISGVVAAASGYGVIQRLQGVKVVIAYVDAKLNPDMPGRVQSYFDNPNTFAEVLVMLLPLTLALVLCSRRNIGKLAAACVWALGVAALLMTYSRAGWLGFALSILVMVLALKPIVLLPLGMVCLAAIPLLPSAVWTRITTITNLSDTTTSSRFPLYEAAWKVIQREPLSGAGLGTDAVKQYIKDYRLYSGRAPFVHAHDLYLEVWIETGIVGLVSFVAAVLWNIKRGLRTARRAARTPAGIITCASSAGLCGIALCAIADYPWHYPRVMTMFWFLFAMVLAGTKVCRMELAELAGPEDFADDAEPADRADGLDHGEPARLEVRADGAAVKADGTENRTNHTAPAGGGSRKNRKKRRRR